MIFKWGVHFNGIEPGKEEGSSLVLSTTLKAID